MEAVVFVVTRKQECDTERTKTSALGVELLVIANMFHELFNGDGFLVLIGIPTGAETRLIDQNVGIGRQTGNVTRYMRAELVGLFGNLQREYPWKSFIPQRGKGSDAMEEKVADVIIGTIE